ncbi:MAG: hypothetical protein NTZ16_15025, partial [Verrucomicrobia bacterium]|nr:hypothetical protein [Verrucomicrobiota bacterium]
MDVFQKLATFGLALLLGAQIEAATNTNSLTASRVEMVFEQAANVRRLSSEQAGLHHPVLLRGVITYTDGTYNTFVQDESAGI